MARESDTEEDAIREFGKECSQLGARLANLGERDTWPSDWLGTPTAREFRDVIEKLGGNDRMALTRFVDHLNEVSNLHRTSTVWLSCPEVFINAFKKPDPTDDDESDAMSPADLFEKACAVVSNYIPWNWRIAFETDDFEHVVEHASSGQLTEMVEWATDVVKTNESGTELTANGGTLLKSIPKPLEHFFDVAFLDGKSTDARLPPKAEGLPDKPSRSREEAMRKIMDRIPNAVAELNEAEGTVAGLEAEVKLARKNLESKQAMLNALNREYVRVRDGGEYQMPLPFTGSEDAATASPSGAAKTETMPGNADEVAGWHLSVLTTKELLQKTNGQSEGAGITDANVDALVDAELGTIGLLEAHMKKHGEFWFRNGLKGIGESKACKIAEALGCLRACYPVDTEPLEPLVLDEDAYHMGFNARVEGHPCSIPNGWSATGMQGRSFVKGWQEGGAK